MSRIVLASGSPRRKELLEQIGLEFEIVPAKGEEVITKTAPEEVVMELSGQKAREVAGLVSLYTKTHSDIMTPQDMLIIGADTVVAAKNGQGETEILGKPKDEADAYRQVYELSRVYSSGGGGGSGRGGRAGEHCFYEKTDVTMRQMSDLEIHRYIETGEPMDKAGAYGIQGKCAIYIEKIDGDYNNVVGLPVSAIYYELQKLGVDIYRW